MGEKKGDDPEDSEHGRDPISSVPIVQPGINQGTAGSSQRNQDIPTSLPALSTVSVHPRAADKDCDRPWTQAELEILK